MRGEYLRKILKKKIGYKSVEYDIIILSGKLISKNCNSSLVVVFETNNFQNLHLKQDNKHLLILQKLQYHLNSQL